MPLDLRRSRGTRRVGRCGSRYCVGVCTEPAPLPEEIELTRLIYDARRNVALREGEPDPGPFVPKRRGCPHTATELLRWRASQVELQATINEAKARNAVLAAEIEAEAG